MLKIRTDQLHAFSAKLHEDFVRQTSAQLVERFPEYIERHGLKHEISPFVERGISEAASYGITQSNDVRLYLECMVLLQPNFASSPEFPWAAMALGSHELSGTEKMNRIHDYLVFAELAAEHKQ
jgi:hypothetical protein